MTRMYFLNYNNRLSSIRSTEIKVFYKLKDLRKFITEQKDISGYVIRQYFDYNNVQQADYLGRFNGFNPSAQEGLSILKSLGLNAELSRCGVNFNKEF